MNKGLLVLQKHIFVQGERECLYHSLIELTQFEYQLKYYSMIYFEYIRSAFDIGTRLGKFPPPCNTSFASFFLAT